MQDKYLFPYEALSPDASMLWVTWFALHLLTLDSLCPREIRYRACVAVPPVTISSPCLRQVAVSRDVPVMRAAWVDRVWEASRQQTVAATDPQFADLTCPPFQGLFICVSQISRRDKEAIKRLIEGNGTASSGASSSDPIVWPPSAMGYIYIS